MITVAGFNTTLDRLVDIDALRPGEVNRATNEREYPGGKGLHVAQTLAALGEPVQLIGLVDTAHRDMIGRRMRERGVLFHGIEIPDSMRTCLALRDAHGGITEILGQGPELAETYRTVLLRAFHRSVDESDLVVLSGSLPRGFPAGTYAEMVMHVRHAGRRCLIDASGEVLGHAVTATPFLIKPNRDEISSLLGHPVDDIDAAIHAARELFSRGIAMPVITMGALGAVAVDESGIWHARIDLAEIHNTVGSGDCLLAGLAAGIARKMNLEETLRLGVACGAANAQGEETGFVERRAVEALLSRVRVQHLG